MTNLLVSATNTAANAGAAAVTTVTPFIDRVITYFSENSSKILGGIFIVVVGVIISRSIAKVMNRALERRLLDPPLRMLLVRLARYGTLAIALVIALETCGFHMTALIAGISVAGVGVGIAMQGLLSNIIAGLTIIFTKPFRVGDGDG
ncbi:MAG: mechanosensitive ion channel domain-containing protein [Limisphaerales bacterium]